MADESKFKENKNILDSFLEIREIENIYKVNHSENGESALYGYIYCIENKLKHKKYIGSTYSIWVGIKHADVAVPLRKRAIAYIYEYNKAKEYSTSTKKLCRPIVNAMVTDGIENFVMYPIAETTRQNHSEAEVYFIKKFNTIENGYNVHLKGGAFNKVGYGRSLSNEEKKLRSEPVICININTKQMLFADSMKIFADYIGTSKDMIKNINRSIGSYKGWFVVYKNKYKREALLSAIKSNETTYQKHKKIGDKRIKFMEELYSSIDLFLSDYTKSEYFSDFELLPSLEYK